ncbi:hypothetical protein PVAND_013091 [Polypedilum vanderplanki]|uniref:Uncharacterized protein n=1 Tax=Polypedilum vanderplanki TaxID=319348 RepID=A0A9J6CPK7_POLVA|nr:hypothetical protein PVAND_013091 [Polypedilum vanderplanki]
MRKILTTLAVLLLFIAGIFGLPHGESSDHDDSDMWMEPDELPAPEYSVVRSESRVIRQYSSTPERALSGGFVPINRPNYASISRVENYEPEVVSRSIRQNPTTAEQNFFSSFFRNGALNAHSRPFKSSQPQAQANTHAASIAGRYSSNVVRANNFDQSILGSGDFAVIRGGTFYPEDEQQHRFKNNDDFFGSYFNNGHGRPNADRLKQPYYPEDPFENFKDFADINAGSEPGFSHFVVIYANKNSTKPHPSHPSPKNIFEQLQLLDEEKKQNGEEPKVQDDDLQTEDDEREKSDEYDKKLMKLSKYKTKLAKTKVVKKYKKKLGPKIDQQSLDYTDPLLATS